MIGPCQPRQFIEISPEVFPHLGQEVFKLLAERCNLRHSVVSLLEWAWLVRCKSTEHPLAFYVTELTSRDGCLKVIRCAPWR